MRALVIRRLSAALDNLAIEDRVLPPVAADGLCVRIKAAAVNFPDLLMCAGRYQYKPALPFTPGMEFAGEVIAAGEKVKHFALGEAVMGGSQTGAFAQEINVAADAVYPKPEGLSFAEAAASGVAYLTAWVALRRRGQIKAGEVLLVLGAGSGVGLAAVEVGKLLGARVIAAAATEEKRALALRYGADTAIGADESVREEVLAYTDGKGADLVYDPVGGDMFDIARRAIGWNGRYLVIGFASGRIPVLPVNMALIKGFSLVGVRAGEYGRRDPAAGREDRQSLQTLLAQGKLKPHIGKTFPLGQIGEAFALLRTRRALGKIVITP